MKPLSCKLALFALGILLLPPTRAFCATVERVSVDQQSFAVLNSEDTSWKNGDSVCVLHDSKQVACGKVIKTSAKGVIVSVETRSEKIEEGDDVELTSPRAPANNDDVGFASEGDDEQEPVKPEKETAEEYKARIDSMDRLQIVDYHRELIHRRGEILLSDGTYGLQETLKRNYNLSLGAQLFGTSTASSLWPQLYFQVALSKAYSVGFALNYYQYSVSGIGVNTMAGFGMFEYTPMDTLHGVFSRLGIGLGFSNYNSPSADGSTILTGNALSVNFIGNIGWRWLVGDNFNMALSAGVMVSKLPVGESGAANSGNAAVLLPMGLFEMGFCF